MKTVNVTVSATLAGGAGAATKTVLRSGFKGRVVNIKTVFPTAQHANLVATVDNLTNGQALFTKTGATEASHNVYVPQQEADGTEIVGGFDRPYVSEDDVLQFKGATGANGVIKFVVTLLCESYDEVVVNN